MAMGMREELDWGGRLRTRGCMLLGATLLSRPVVVDPGTDPTGDELQPPSPPAPPPPSPPLPSLPSARRRNRRRSRRGRDELCDSLSLRRRTAPATASPCHGGPVPVPPHRVQHGHALTCASLLPLLLAGDRRVSWRRLEGVSSWRRSWRLEIGARSRGERGGGGELTPNMCTRIRTPLEESSNLYSRCGGTHCKNHAVSTCASEWCWR
jgi:hypothetical protein